MLCDYGGALAKGEECYAVYPLAKQSECHWAGSRANGNVEISLRGTLRPNGGDAAVCPVGSPRWVRGWKSSAFWS